MAEDVDQTLTSVGPRLRALRQERETTLADLAAETGISVSTLSRLESGSRRPTLELLLPLARAYDVTLDELVDAPPTGDPRVTLRATRTRGITMLPLTRRTGGIQAYKIVLPGRGPRARAPDSRRTRATSGSTSSTGSCGSGWRTTTWCSSPGEAAEFDTRTPHWFGSAGHEPVEFLSLFGKEGERAHLRARPRPRGSSGS